MDIPIRFPHPADVIAEEAEQERTMSIEQRLARIGQLFAAGLALASSGIGADKRQKVKDGLEDQWRRRHREVIERHGG